MEAVKIINDFFVEVHFTQSLVILLFLFNFIAVIGSAFVLVSPLVIAVYFFDRINQHTLVLIGAITVIFIALIANVMFDYQITPYHQIAQIMQNKPLDVDKQQKLAELLIEQSKVNDKQTFLACVNNKPKANNMAFIECVK